jgi:hypothetical protein
VQAADPSNKEQLVDAVMLFAEQLIQALPRRKVSTAKPKRPSRAGGEGEDLDDPMLGGGERAAGSLSHAAAGKRAGAGARPSAASPAGPGLQGSQHEAMRQDSQPPRRAAPSSVRPRGPGGPLGPMRRAAEPSVASSLSAKGLFPVPLPVATAMHMMRSLLLGSGGPTASDGPEMQRRFSDEQVESAVIALRAVGFLLSPAAGERKHALTLVAAMRSKSQGSGEGYAPELLKASGRGADGGQIKRSQIKGTFGGHLLSLPTVHLVACRACPTRGGT